MKKLSDTTERRIFLKLEWHEIADMVRQKIKEDGYNFESKEVELNFKFIEEGSPAYKTNKIECDIKITKEL